MISFDELSEKRRRVIEALRENHFEDGLRRLLADLYPDSAHFIYELLQNAEDAGASEVLFDLRPEGLYMEHNGPNLFDLKDIDSITSIGQSTKADDPVSIGKFGVGFKAVFAYTKSPIIHSGEYSFEITDLFVPSATKPNGRPDTTTFWLPFNRADKSAARAAEEVGRALSELSHETLLFLRNISAISCSLPGDERLLERTSITNDLIAIDAVHDGEGPTHWYRIADEISVAGERYPVAAAFALDNKDPNAPATLGSGEGAAPLRVSSQDYVVRPTHGQVFIYFPAVKETSGLRFHVHAPFASTVARDSVRDDAANDALISGLADLIASALPRMRDAGLLTDSLLSALPNRDDDLGQRYEPIRSRILETFQTQDVTPISGGAGYAPSKRLIRSVGPVRASLETKDVDLLREISRGYPGSSDGWLLERDGSAGAFLDSLKAIDFKTAELAEVFDRVSELIDHQSLGPTDNEHHLLRAWNDWISDKDDEWMRTFYIALGRLTEQGRNPFPRNDFRHRTWYDPFPLSLEIAPIVRVHFGNSRFRHVVGADSYLPSESGLRSDGLVLDRLLPFSESSARADLQEAHALNQFYSHVRARPWNASAQLDARFKTYDEFPPQSALEEHFRDLRELERLINEKLVAAEAYNARKILLSYDDEDRLTWFAPSAVYLDAPFGKTGLHDLYSSPQVPLNERKRPLAREYLACNLEIEGLARALGVGDPVQISPVSPKFKNSEFSWGWVDHENYNKTERDWDIPSFEAIVSTDNPTLLRRLWKVVSDAPADRADAVYRANGSSRTHAMQSQLLQRLTTIPWVLDKYGNRALPEDMTVGDLDEGLDTSHASPLLERSGFGRNAAEAQQKKTQADALANQFGGSSQCGV